MNIQEYIASGAVEAYVLGVAGPEERAEFERLCAEYPELVQARNRFEQSLEEQALATAAAPPSFMRERILAAVREETSAADAEESVLLSMPKDRGVHPAWRWAAAASFLLLGLSLVYITQLNRDRGQALQMATDLQLTRDSLNAIKNRMEQILATTEVFTDGSTTLVKLKGVATQPNGQAMVYWNTSSQEVLLVLNQLPQPSQGKQYQLWAIADGKPVDAGTVEYASGEIQKMKTIPKAQAFAITLEKEGGSPTPTLEAMYVLGNL